tara:strand:+ start:539 stop:757 length:219 start_codon:yes stop_codon:yes gene_type:complete
MSIRKKQIINYIKNNPNCTSFDISNAIGISIPMVRFYLRSFKKDDSYKNILKEDLTTREGKGRPFSIYSIIE